MNTIVSTYKKYGYKMFDCTIQQMQEYNASCYDVKETPNPRERFPYVNFNSVDSAVKLINSVFIPPHHGNLPSVEWRLQAPDLLVKEITFHKYEHQALYQTSIERAWAMGGHLDPRVEQHYYD